MKDLIESRQKLFRAKFVRDDGLMDKYYDEDTMAEAIEEFNSETARLMVEQIEEFAHKEMKDGNWAYEKLLILLTNNI